MWKYLSRKSIVTASVCAAAAILSALFVVARGASAEATATTTSVANLGATTIEPTSLAPTVPNRGSEAPMRDPFAPFDSGPIEGRWNYTSLRPSEQQDLERERTTNARTNWVTTHDGFASALAEQATAAASTAAARQLGIDNLATLGVVP